MNRARFAFAATLVGALGVGGSTLFAQADQGTAEFKSVLAGQEIHAAVSGEARGRLHSRSPTRARRQHAGHEDQGQEHVARADRAADGRRDLVRQEQRDRFPAARASSTACCSRAKFRRRNQNAGQPEDEREHAPVQPRQRHRAKPHPVTSFDPPKDPATKAAPATKKTPAKK